LTFLVHVFSYNVDDMTPGRCCFCMVVWVIL